MPKIVKSDPPETKEILAEAIVRIGKGMKQLTDSGLNKDAVLVLLYEQTKVAKRDIRAIIEALPRLAGWYCR